MKLLILILPALLYGYYNSYDYYLLQQAKTRQREIALKERMYYDKKELDKKRKHDRDIERGDRRAKLANERYYQKLKYESRYNNNYQKPQIISNKKKLNAKYFKGKPEIKLGELHIFGIKSIKPFKNNKLIIKAANGTFALPKEKFKKAKKINFNDKLTKQIGQGFK